MKKVIILLSLLILPAATVWATDGRSLQSSVPAPVRVILDTDMDTDCDDAGALAVLNALADNGEVKILATVTCSRNLWTPQTISAINTYYGRPNLLIGAPKGDGPMCDSKYARQIAENFPHQLPLNQPVPDAIDIYRQVLEATPDHSVTLVTIGYLSNVAELLKRPARLGHPSGLELARNKIRLWVCMGGNFVGTPAHDDLKLGDQNFTVDSAATLYAIKHWPGSLMFVGREIGSAPSGLKAGARLVETPENNPVRAVYAIFHGGIVKSRHIADPTTVLFAVRGLRDYWNVHTNGFMDLQPDMTFTWKDGPAGRQGYLLKWLINGQSNDHYIEQTVEALMIQPPRWLAGGVH